MSWKVIFLLSLFGVAVGFAGVYGLSGTAELIVWLFIFVIFAVVIVRSRSGDYFVHALLASILAGLWVGIMHAAFINTYVAHNARLRAGYAMIPKTAHPRLMMVLTGPFIGAVMGVVAGLMAAVAGKILKRKEPADSIV